MNLPIDDHLDDLVARLRAGRDVVLCASPGSGKTTRVPPALVDARLPGGGSVLVLEPRRMAARLAARRVAGERGEPVGGTVGYRVRFERRESDRTRLWFLTEGLLTRRLVDDPDLAGVSVVVFDEFHERSLQADLGLGLVREIQATLRDDLRVVVMSATLDAAALAGELDADVVEVEGRRYPIDVEHAPRRDDDRVAQRAARALLREIDRDGGRLGSDTLVFLPGTGEIHELRRALGDLPDRIGFDLLPLFGDLSVDDQDRAVRRGPRPRVVAATNVAETSITLDGIARVIDGGLARVMRRDPRTGVEELRLERITKASAEQRAGRAGRQGPGRCVRLFTEGELRELDAQIEPEVLRVDLAGALLALKSWGSRDARRFAWITPPPAAAIESAERLLYLLGACDEEWGAITAVGREMARLPVAPRVARMLVEAKRLGLGEEAALIAALCGSRPLMRRDRPSDVAARSDLLVLRDRFHEAAAARFDARALEPRSIDARAARAVDRERRQLARFVGGGRGDDEEGLLRCAVAGHPDRVTRRRADGKGGLMVGGVAVELARGSAVRDAPVFVAVSVTALGARRPAQVAVASEAREEWLRELFPGRLVERTETVWVEDRGRAEGRRVVRFFDLVLRESRSTDVDPSEAEALLVKAATHPRFLESLRAGGLRELLARVECLARFRPDLGVDPADDEALRDAVTDVCAGRTALRDVDPREVAGLLLQRLGGGDPRRIDRLVPQRLELPSGRAATITYSEGQPPLVSAKLQEFFGVARSPRIGDGAIPVTVDLLAPNGRSVQITRDLESFWKELYPRERRELARRYPRHPWPEDPMSAKPTHRPLPRRR